MIIEMKSYHIQNVQSSNLTNQPYNVIGNLRIKFEDDIWTYSEVLCDQPYLKNYSNEFIDYNDYINNKNKKIFLYYDNNRFVGIIRLQKYWNKYAFIDDIAVEINYRGQGIGTMLMDKAVEWAMDIGMNGLSLETQDNNILACRFYKKYGFKIGAVDTFVYKNLSEVSNEKAVYWYLRF